VHELAITRNVVAIVGEAAKGRRVTHMTLEIGKLSGVPADAVAFCFDIVAAGTPAAGAQSGDRGTVLVGAQRRRFRRVVRLVAR